MKDMNGSEIANKVNSRTYLSQQMLQILLHENIQKEHENHSEIGKNANSRIYSFIDVKNAQIRP